MAPIKIRVAAILLAHDHLLICRQHQHPFYILPGGTLEPGEGIDDCVVRELREETGLVIEPVKLLYVLDWISTTRHVHEVFFLARLQQEPVDRFPQLAIPPAPITELRWVHRTEFPELQIEPAPIAQALRLDWETNFTHVEGSVLGAYQS